MTYTSCVPDCGSVNPYSVNNAYYGICETTGSNCALSSNDQGCLKCYDNNYFYLANSSSITINNPNFKVCSCKSYFNRPLECTNRKICNSCSTD